MEWWAGAPLAPIFHAALFAAVEKPTAVLNIGGGKCHLDREELRSMLSFDTGPGNALIDDWVQAHGAGDYDESEKTPLLARSTTLF